MPSNDRSNSSTRSKTSLRLVASATLFMSLCGAWTNTASAQQTVVVVLDDSGSMADQMRGSQLQKMDAAKAALLEVLASLPEDTRVGVLALNTSAQDSHWIVPLESANRGDWTQNINRIQARGGTPLGEYMQLAANALLEERGKEVYGTYRMLIVTDGEANDSDLVEYYTPQIMSRGIVTDVIGVDMESDHSLATQVHSYRRADDERALRAAIAEVFAENSASDQNAEEDFELIAGLPDEVAVAALQALSRPRNDLLEEVREARNSESFPRGGGNAGDGVVEFLLGSTICCGGSFAMMVLLLTIVLRAAKRRSR